MTSLHPKNDNSMNQEEEDVEKEENKRHNYNYNNNDDDDDDNSIVLESSSSVKHRFFSCSMEMSETVVTGSPSINLNYSKSGSTSSSQRCNNDDTTVVSAPFHTPPTPTNNDTTTTTTTTQDDNNNTIRMGEDQGIMRMMGQQQQQQQTMMETIDNNTAVRPRFDSEEYYRALAESHAASNPYDGFFNVHNKGNNNNNNNNNSSNNNGSQHSRNNSGSVLYCDTNSEEAGSIILTQQNNNRNLSNNNRDRLSSYDSTGNNSLVILHNKRNNPNATRPTVTHHNTNNNPIEASPKVLPYHKRKKLAESANDIHRNRDSSSRSNNNNNNSINHKGIEMDSNNHKMDASALRTNKLTTISSINFAKNTNNHHHHHHLPKQQLQQKLESYKRNPLKINTSTSNNNNNNTRHPNLHHYSPDENTDHKGTGSTNTTDSIRFTRGYNNSGGGGGGGGGGNISSDSSSPTKEIQDHNDAYKSSNKIGLPRYPTRGGTGKDTHNYHDTAAPQQLLHLQPLQTGYHIRADSGGSVSSLGSNTGGAGSFARNTGGSLTDRLGKEISSFIQDSNINDPDKKHSHNLFNLLHGMVENNSPKSSHHSIEDEMADFHSKNQAFLQKAEKERNKRNLVYSDIKSISKTKRAIRSRSPRPPNSQGAHRPGLSSIDNDNWEEDNANNKYADSRNSIPHSHRGRSKKNDTRQSNFDPKSNIESFESNRYHDYQTPRKKEFRSPQPNIRQYSPTPETRNKKNYDMDLRYQNYSVDKRSATKKRYGATPSSDKNYRPRNDINLRSTIKKDNRSKPRIYHMTDNDSVSTSSFPTSELDSSYIGSSHTESESSNDNRGGINEKTCLLPPSGISTYEGKDKMRQKKLKKKEMKGQTSRKVVKDKSRHTRGKSSRRNDRFHNDDFRQWEEHQKKKSRRKKRDNRYNSRYHSKYKQRLDLSTDDDSYSDDDHYRYRDWTKKKVKKMLIQERAKLLENWKAEARAEVEAQRLEQEKRRWHYRLREWMSLKFMECSNSGEKLLSNFENFISNLPLVIGAVALAIVTLGVVWFKFAEENMNSCQPVHFHSSQCSFPEFPGCFYCDTTARMYKVALYFHYFCSTLSGFLALLFFAKIFLAWRVVMDEMSSPTTSSPAGLICMTMVCVFAGRGLIGQILVTMAACMHLCLAAWFVYLALAYNIMPEPSWYPNTVGIGLSAVKTWLYYPIPGYFLMAISLSLNIFFFPISLVRVTLNKKMSAPVCWIQMSAPAVALYALTIMAQPAFEEEHPDMTQFQRIHRRIYMPIMHFLFLNSLIGVMSSVQGLFSRWESFSKKEFSPAHAAFCFPTLAHANAVQAYRGAIDSFSNITPGSSLKIAIYSYWVIVLVGGTIATLIITTKFFSRLPSWTQVDITDEDEPPAPNETVMSEVILIGENVRQNYVSPAVLQANETGQLIRHRGADGRMRYVRTRRVTALGFEPIMNQIELQEERDALLEWAAKNPARARKRTLSVPGIDFSHRLGADFGTGNTGVWYDTEANTFRDRAFTEDANNQRRKRGSTMYY